MSRKGVEEKEKVKKGKKRRKERDENEAGPLPIGFVSCTLNKPCASRGGGDVWCM